MVRKKAVKKISVKIGRKSGEKKTKRSKELIFVFLGGAVALLVGIISVNTFNNPNRTSCANSISCIKDLSGKFEREEKTGVYEGEAVAVPVKQLLAYVNPQKDVLGQSAGGKKIAVDLSTQHLYAYEGDRVVMDFPVSTGKWKITPTGTFAIWIKLRYTRMTGGSGAGYYNLPNVPYTMYFAGSGIPKTDGYGIHGAYWHNNFGHPMSHGCINMKIADAGQLFAWASPSTDRSTTLATADNPGTQVEIYGTTPVE